MRRAMLLLPALLAMATGVASRTGNRARPGVVAHVSHVLMTLPYSGIFDHLSFRLDDRSVTLTGHVTWPTLRDDAERSVSAIHGVERVINRIEVLPLSHQDDRLRLAEFRAIYGDPVLRRYALEAVPPIRIVVENGSVTLEGVVATEADKRFAEARASSPPDVLSVTNNLVANAPRAAQTPTRAPRSFASRGTAASIPGQP